MRDRQSIQRSGSALIVVQGVLRDEILPPIDPTLLPTIGRMRVYSRSETDNATAAITGLPTSTTITVSGNRAAQLLASQIAVITGSTGNDGAWLLTDATYDQPTNKTTLTLSRDLPSSVADGHVRLPEIADAGQDVYVVNRDVSLRLAAGTWLVCVAVANELVPIVPGCVRVLDPAMIPDL